MKDQLVGWKIVGEMDKMIDFPWYLNFLGTLARNRISPEYDVHSYITYYPNKYVVIELSLWDGKHKYVAHTKVKISEIYRFKENTTEHSAMKLYCEKLINHVTYEKGVRLQ